MDLTTLHSTHTGQAPAYPTVRQAFAYWLHLGCISFGGPAAQIGLMHQALVVEKRWISDARFLHALNFCMVLPGPEAQQLAIYMGWLLHGTWGGVMAGVLFVLPAFLLLISVSWAYLLWGNLPAVAGFLYGIKPLVVALILVAAYRLAKRVLKRPWLWGLAMVALGLRLIGVSYPALIAGAALLSWGCHRWQPQRFALVASHPSHATSPAQLSVIDEHTCLPALSSTRRHALQVLAVALVLGGGALVGLCWVFGVHHLYSQLAIFFTQAALLTFGGAYAVLPYVFEASVTQFHWLTTPQMLDGLALGESTPGPLIMIVTYIGFVAGWGHGLALALAPWWSAVIAACIVTWFTFLPSFIMIFLGAPWIERSRQALPLAAPLTGISAAVVGVIVHLALQVGQSVVWPSEPDALAVGLLLAAMYLLIKQRLHMGLLLLGFGAAGVMLKASPAVWLGWI